MKRLAYLVCLILLLSGCTGLKFPRLPSPIRPSAPQGAKTSYTWREKTVKKPRIVTCKGDEAVVVEETTQEVDIAYGKQEAVPKRLTVLERISRWISDLSVIAGIALIVGMIFFPAATLSFLVKKIYAYKRAMKETVKAVKQAKAVENKELHDALRETQSAGTRKIVGNLKADL